MSARMRMLFPLAAAVVAAAAFASAGADTIQNFHRVNDRVAVGGQPTPEQIKLLSEEGFNAIINLREESEFNDGAQFHEARDMGVLFIRVPVSMTDPTDAQVAKFLEVTDDASIYPVFIYCAEGNRAAGLWMIRRVLRDKWTFEKAEAEARAAGLSKPATVEFARGYIARHPAS